MLLVAEGQALLAPLGDGRLGGLGEGRGVGESWEEEARKRVEVERKEYVAESLSVCRSLRACESCEVPILEIRSRGIRKSFAMYRFGVP